MVMTTKACPQAAARSTLTESYSASHEHAKILHSFAITERVFDDDEPVKASKLGRKNSNAPSAEQAAH
jgi:hypothetical protein